MYKLRETCGLCRLSLPKIIRKARYLQTATVHFPKNAELGTACQPKDLQDCYSGTDYFTPEITSNKPFSLILPPPNITGTLHLGHALTATVQDVIVRWNRMRGIETLWVPGIDHAGIATQVVVEKHLWKQNHQTLHDIGRQDFQSKVWKWKEEKAKVIEQQLRTLGVCLDWPRAVFTMDASQARAVSEAFVRLFESGLIYRADHLVNWSCALQSAISDIEVDHLEVDGPTGVPVPGYDKSVEFGFLTHFAYKLCDSDEEVVVATTRPETMLGDVAVAVNPNDDRYRPHVGRNLWHPFRKQTIPIICDDFVDPAFGTGAVKVTPAHDHVDFEVGKRHGLAALPVIDEKGNLTDVCGEFSGMRRFDARNSIVSQLAELQLLRGRQHHKMIVPICSRSRDVVEFLVRPQWFVKCSQMADRAVEDVKEGRLVIEPKHFESTWFNWLQNTRDWCLSRQLWWGHQIPAYICNTKDRAEDKIWVAAVSTEEALHKASAQLSTPAHNVELRQDEDVLDTWFSSGLLPFSSLGWPQETADLALHYPLSLMETGHDILFFWVARMVMLGTELTGRLPFNKILLHGIVCDAQGRKMSKSLGNVVAPEDIISGSTLEELKRGSKASHQAGVLSSEELDRAIQGQKRMFPQGIPECGSDALRFTLCSHNIKSHFINFEVQECHINRLFCNKIWQATKFTNIWVDKVSEQRQLGPVQVDKLTVMDRWILSRLSEMLQISWKGMENYDFHLVTSALKNFLYFEFCDVYLETTKRGLRGADGGVAAGHCWTLVKSLDTALRVLAPFMPRLAQHLHQNLRRLPQVPVTLNFPSACDSWRNEELEKQVEGVLEIVTSIRRMKKTFGVTAKDKPEAHIVSDCSLCVGFREAVEDLAACHKVSVASQPDKALIRGCVTDRVNTDTIIYLAVPEELRRKLVLDLPTLEAKKAKLIKDLDRAKKMVSGEGYKAKVSLEMQEAHSKRISTLNEKIDRINYMQSFASQQQW